MSANDDVDDELLSAYLDGELTSEEQSLVEERLRADPQARKLVEEMRLMSSALQALPRQTLGRDLRDDVRAETERATIAGRVTPATEPRLDRWTGIRRGLVWSAITIAAALVLMVTQPDRRQDADVADARRKSADGEDRRKVLADEAPRAVRGPADVPKMSAAKEPSNSDELFAEAASPPLARGGAAELTDAEAADKSGNVADAESELMFRATTELGEIDALPSREAPAETGTTRALQGGEDASALSGLRQRASDAAPRDAPEPASVPLAATEAPVDAAEGASPAPAGLPPTPAPGPANLESFGFHPPTGRDTRGDRLSGIKAHVVELATLTPEATSRFEELLSKNGIEFGDAAMAAPLAAGKDDVAKSLHESADLAAGDRVMVEASPEQIAALLVDCQAEAETFAAVAPAEGDYDQEIAAGFGQAEKKGKEGLGARGYGGFGGGLGGGLPPVGERVDEKSSKGLQSQTAEKPAADSKSGEMKLGRAWRLPTPLPEAASLEKNDRSANGRVNERRSAAAAAAAVQPGADAGGAGVAAPADPAREEELTVRKQAAATDEKQMAQVQVLFILRPAPLPAAEASPPKE